jgi:DNA-binding winged helix-turn-helix (wHTH) protein
MLFVCDRWEVDLNRRQLRAGGIAVPVGGRAFEIIKVLVRSGGQLVTKDDLFAQVWAGAIVEENTLQVHISAVRKALGPDRELLKTVSGRGYRLLGNWTGIVVQRSWSIPRYHSIRSPSLLSPICHR